MDDDKHKLVDGEDTFVIYALLEDAAGETLEDTGHLHRDHHARGNRCPGLPILSDDPDTMEVVSITGGDDLEDDQIRVDRLGPRRW